MSHPTPRVAGALAMATLSWLAACGGSPPTAPPPPPPEPIAVDPAALPLPVAPPPQVPLPGEVTSSASPLLGRSLLPNGLNVAILRRAPDATHTASFTLQFAAGTDHGKQGAADLAAWLFVQGADLTAGRPSLMRQIERLGGTLSIEQGPISTWFTVRIDEDRWRQALQAVATTLTAPPPSRGLLERAQHDLLLQRTGELLDAPIPANAARMLLGDAGGGEHLASLRDRDPSEGVVFQSRNYRPDRGALVLEVPGDLATIGSVVQGQFASWQAAKVAPDPQQGPHERGLAPGIHWAQIADGTGDAAGPCRCGLVLALPDPTQPLAPAAHLLLNCLSMDGLGGRLEKLQQESGLRDIAWSAEFVHRAEARALVLTARAAPDQIGRLWQVAERARASLRDLPPTSSERAFARSRVWLTLRRADCDSDTRLRALALRELQGLGEDQLLERLTDLEQPDALSPAAVDAFLALPMAMIVVGGQPPADLAAVPRFDLATNTLAAAEPHAAGDQLIAAATPWLDQALQAIGGRDRIRRVTGLEATAKVATDGAPDIDETFKWTIGGNLERARTVLGATVETKIDGKQWTEQVGTEQVQLTPIEATWRLGEIERHPLALLAMHSRGQLRFRLLAMQHVDGRDHVLLEAVTDRFERLRMQMDRESGLVRVVESWSTSPEGLPTRAVDTWSDYRTVDGIRVPYRRVTVVDDGQSRRTVDFQRVQPTTR